VRTPIAALEFTNILLTQGDAKVGVTPKDVVWTHRKTTLYPDRSDQRRHAIPVLLVFALINRPDIFNLRHGSSFVEYLLEEGFDVFLINWSYPEEEGADMGLDNCVWDQLGSGTREALRRSGQEELSLLGWCIGGTLSLLHGGVVPDNPVRNMALLTTPVDARVVPDDPVRNMALLTTPVDARASLYERWVGRESFDVEYVADGYKGDPGPAIDWANKMMKPVTSYWTTCGQH
jgi:polyhydroxyalkanoate synthase subunit PhaC